MTEEIHISLDEIYATYLYLNGYRPCEVTKKDENKTYYVHPIHSKWAWKITWRNGVQVRKKYKWVENKSIGNFFVCNCRL